MENNIIGVFTIRHIEYVDVEKVVPYINNPRNNEVAVDRVAASIKEFGFNVPLVLDNENVIITGHTRHKAAKKLGLDKVPCIYAEGLTKAQIKAYRIADNKVSEFASWDDELLSIEFEELQELGFNLELTGFDMDDIDNMLNPAEEVLTDLSDEVKDTYEVIVECINETEQEQVYNNLISEGYKCRVLTL